MRTRRYALHERIRAKEFQLKEVLRRLDRQRLLEMFPVGIHPSTPLQFRSSGSTVFIDAPLTAIVRASQRVWQVDPSPVPDPVGGFQDITIPELNVDAALLADTAVNFAGQSAGTYIIYAAHQYSEEHAESRQPPGIFADGAGVNPTHRDFFGHEHPDGTAIPREAYDPSLTPTTVSEIADRLTVGFALQGNVPPGVAELVRVAWNGSAITATDPVFRYSDVTDIRTIEDRVNAHIGAGGNAHPVASPTVAGFMSAADKTKLNNVPANTSNALANKADLVGGRIPNAQLPTSGTANRVLKVGAANSNPVYDQVNFNELTGTIAGSQIPAGEITDSKIASGISASKISGVLTSGNIPSLDAGKITSGTFAPARIQTLLAVGGTAGTDRVDVYATRIIGTLAVSQGGTGSTSLTANRYIRANSSGTGIVTRTNSQVLQDIGAAPAAHTHNAGDIIGGRLALAQLPTSGTANRFLKVGTANTSPAYSTVTWNDVQSKPSSYPPSMHSHARPDLPVGADNATQVAPGQDMSGTGDARHPVGSMRLLVHSTWSAAVPLGVDVPGSTLRIASSWSSTSGSVTTSGFRLASQAPLPGTWRAITAAGGMPAEHASNRNPFLAVRIS